MDVVQWLKLCQLLVDWQSPRGTAHPPGEAGWDGILFFRHKGGRKIFTHSLSACGETRPTTNEGGGGRPKKEQLS
jgi:hypothetical protein